MKERGKEREGERRREERAGERSGEEKLMSGLICRKCLIFILFFYRKAETNITATTICKYVYM